MVNATYVGARLNDFMIITNAILTAYCACAICCGKHAKQGLTASGNKPTQGITIAASRSIPLGSKVTLSNGHTYIVQDRLAKRFDSRFDIYFTSHKAALEFGKKKGETVIVVN